MAFPLIPEKGIRGRAIRARSFLLDQKAFFFNFHSKIKVYPIFNQEKGAQTTATIPNANNKKKEEFVLIYKGVFKNQ